jgi:hypothetical protein
MNYVPGSGIHNTSFDTNPWCRFSREQQNGTYFTASSVNKELTAHISHAHCFSGAVQVSHEPTIRI